MDSTLFTEPLKWLVWMAAGMVDLVIAVLGLSQWRSRRHGHTAIARLRRRLVPHRQPPTPEPAPSETGVDDA